jgi:hypothetical protein
LKKIKSLFERDYQGDRRVIDRVVPGAEWVAAGEGLATRKFDGTAVLVQGGRLFKRYDAKGGKTPPPDFMPSQPAPDPVTGHWPGWVPVGDGPADRWHRETFAASGGLPDGTYELCGPKVGGNPEGLSRHFFIRHGLDLLHGVPRDFNGLREYLTTAGIEGVVWWRDPADPDCDKVKIKAKDFGIRRGQREEGK